MLLDQNLHFQYVCYLKRLSLLTLRMNLSVIFEEVG